MVRARFEGSNHYHDGELLEGGETLDLPERHYEKFSHKFVLLEEEDAESAESESVESEADSDEDPDESAGGAEESAESEESASDEQLEAILDGTVDEVEEALTSGDYDDVLDDLERLEYSGDNRKTVHDAIEDRRED